MQRIVVIIFMLLASMACKAQCTQVSYSLHNGVQPGINLAFLKPLTSKTKTKEKRNGTKTIIKTNYISPVFNYYYHLKKEHNFRLGAELVRERHIKRKAQWRYAPSLGLNYVRSFNIGPTYEVTDDGEVNKIPLAGQNFIAPSVAFRIERNIHVIKDIRIILQPRALFLLPYNGGILPSGDLNLGIILPLKHRE